LIAGPWRPVAAGAATVILGLAFERLAAGVAAARRFRTLTPLVFPVLHLARDLAWVAAIAMWSARRLGGRPSQPSHSMYPRPLAGPSGAVPRRHALEPETVALEEEFTQAAGEPERRRARPTRILCLIPAYNEASNLASVVAEVRSCRPDLDILVVDDGSTDGTASLLERLGVRWLRFPQRLGIGSAMRAGLGYAARLGYDAAVRVDGDGQHQARDIEGLLAPVEDGRADVVLGSRYTEPDVERTGNVRFVQRLLGACLSALTGRCVTDPTCGFCALGPRAIRVLAEHHPTGYPEAELQLFLSRNVLTAMEVPVRGRSRLRGKTSLTPGRVTAAGARVVLAMLIVPLRRRIRGLAGD
jgi:glycosyl transferase family 2